MYRQGDILIIKVDTLPKGLKLKKDLIILYGEATGHAHRLEKGKIYFKGEEIYLVLGSNSRIVHDEHNPIELEKGIYAIRRQKEYVSSDMTRIVVD